MNTTNLTPESQELIKILEGINTLNIYAVRFYPSTSNPFNVMTKNMKKISLMIIWKTNKIEFKPGELNGIFEKIKTHLPDRIGQEKRMIIENAVWRFINEWWKVEIITWTSRAKREILTFISFFIVILWAFWILCGWGAFIWIKSKFLFIILLITYSVYLYFHFQFTNAIEKKLKDETIDILPDSISYKLFNGWWNLFIMVIVQLLFNFFVFIFNPFK